MEISSQLSIKGTNILIVWNRSYKNLGDELILVGTIKLLQQQGKNIYIQAYDANWLKWFLKQFVDVSEIIFLTEIPKWPRSIFNYIRNQKRKELLDYRKLIALLLVAERF